MNAAPRKAGVLSDWGLPTLRGGRCRTRPAVTAAVKDQARNGSGSSRVTGWARQSAESLGRCGQSEPGAGAEREWAGGVGPYRELEAADLDDVARQRGHRLFEQLEERALVHLAQYTAQLG